MKATISLEGLLALIHAFSLSASNKRWLGEKLIEEAHAEEAKPAHISAGKEAKPAHISAGKFYGVWKDEDYPELSADELAKEIKASRKFREDVMTF